MAETGTITVAAPLSWESLSTAADDHGASFYLADVRRFEENYRRFLYAFRAIYPRTSIGYSYKTNYLPELVLRADALGAYSEVVSQFELELARALGVPAERILFNGPIKRRPDLIGALTAGTRVNVDSIAEVREIVAGAVDLPPKTPLGLRCWLGSHTPGSRFGVDLEGAEGKAAVAALDAAPNVRIAGLHCHFSGNRSADQYRRIARSLIRLHQTVLSHRQLDYIDVGGGFASNMPPSLAAQLPAPPSTFEEYADAIATEVRAAYGAQGPELILEPGMGLLADVMLLVTRVEAVKRLGSRRLAVVDGSIFNIKPLRGSADLPVRVVASDLAGVPGEQEEEAHRQRWDIVGHTCMEIDVLHQGYVGTIRPGNYVVVENVGAYTNVLNAPFIRGTPAILEYGDDGIGKLLRPASTVSDLLRSYGYGTAA